VSMRDLNTVHFPEARGAISRGPTDSDDTRTLEKEGLNLFATDMLVMNVRREKARALEVKRAAFWRTLRFMFWASLASTSLRFCL
jgi:hypothetical protein